MDRIAAKIPEEIGMLLKDRDLHAGACKQEPEDNASRPATNDYALDDKIGCSVVVGLSHIPDRLYSRSSIFKFVHIPIRFGLQLA
jgi:hypothetical protein